MLFCILNSVIPFLLGLSYVGLVIYDRWILAVEDFRGEFCVQDIRYIQCCNWSDNVPGHRQETSFSDLTVTSCRGADLGTHAALLKFWELVVLGTDWSLPGNRHLQTGGRDHHEAWRFQPCRG